MPILFGILFILGIIGAILCKKKGLIIPMVGCIIVSIACAFLVACTFILAWAARNH